MKPQHTPMRPFAVVKSYWSEVLAIEENAIWLPVVVVVALASNAVAIEPVFKPHFAQTPDDFAVITSTSITSYSDFKIQGSTPVAPDCIGVSCY